MNFCRPCFLSAIVATVMAGVLLFPASMNAEPSSPEEETASSVQDNNTDTERTVDTTLLEITPPPGWERMQQQEPGLFNGCYVYAYKDPSQHKEVVGVLACMVKSWQEGCARTEKDAELGTVQYFGKAVYKTVSDTNLFICMPTLEGKDEAFFAVLAEDSFRKHEARNLLTQFKHFAVPPEVFVPAPDLQAYFPPSFTGEEGTSPFGGLLRTYKAADRKTFEASAIVLPYFPHWGDITQSLRSFKNYFNNISPDGAAWKGERSQNQPVYISLSQDEKALLVLRCADQNAAGKYKAAFDKFAW